MAAGPQPVEQNRDAPHVATVLRLVSAMQRTAVALTVLVAVVAVVVAAVLRGTSGAVAAGVAAGVGLVIGVIGTLVMRATARVTPVGVLLGALTSFAGKIGLLLVILIVVERAAVFDERVFGFVLLAVTAAYVAGELIAFLRTRTPSVDL